jgi:hypothetical protein
MDVEPVTMLKPQFNVKIYVPAVNEIEPQLKITPLVKRVVADNGDNVVDPIFVNLVSLAGVKAVFCIEPSGNSIIL